MTSFSFRPFDLVFKCPSQPLFISKLSFFPFRKIYYFLTTLSFLLHFSLLAFFFFPKSKLIFPLWFRASNRGHWKSLILVRDSNTGNNIVIKAHLSWKLLFHLIKPVCPGATEDLQEPSKETECPKCSIVSPSVWLGGENSSLLPVCHINFSEGQVKSNVSSWGNRGNRTPRESNYPSWNLTRLAGSTPQLSRKVWRVFPVHQRSLYLFLWLIQKVAPPGIRWEVALKKRLTCASEKREMTWAASFSLGLACPQQTSLNIDFVCAQVFNQETQD